MWRIGCLLVLAIVACVIALPVVASRYLPAWQTALLVVAEVAVLVFVVPKLVKWGFKRVAGYFIGMKSKVLRGAKVDVHSVAVVPKPLRRVTPAAPAEEQLEEIETPDGTVVTGPVPAEEPAAKVEEDDQDEKDEPGTRYVRVDCTITPVGAGKAGTPMQFYDPDEMMLVSWDRKVSFSEMLKSGGDGDKLSATCEESTVIGGDPDNDSGKYAGEQRVEFVFKCPPTLRGRVKFQYYFEAFGELQLPN